MKHTPVPMADVGVRAGMARLDRRDLVDAQALARMLGVSAKSVARYIARGRLPKPLIGGLWFAGQILDHLEAEAARLNREAMATAAARARGRRRRDSVHVRPPKD